MNLNNLNFCNYHKHSVWTNPIVPDSVESIENYAQRAVDLGQKILSCVEHGWTGNYINTYEVCQKYNLKFLFGVEAYWVYDRLAYYDENKNIVDNSNDGKKDKTNNHIVILAKNENGRRAINKMLSQSAKDGFYYRTRIDINQILSLPKDDVWITSACIAFNGYGFDDSYNVIKKLHNYFKDNFYLEVQYHNTPSQIKWNSLLKDWSKELNINLIMGCDSHYVYEEDAWKRTDYIKSKGIEYPDEEGWYMDYPSTEIAFKRFQEQGVFNDDEIYNIINNTNEFENVEEYNCPIFNTDIKMPTLYPELTEQEKNLKLAKLVHEKWSEEKKKISKDKWPIYEKEIKRELQTIFDVDHSDYFLLYYEGIKRGIELGGVATPTGRGCFTNDEFVKTNNGFKTLDKIVVGDKVISSDGKFHAVIDTMNYDVNEDMIKISYVSSSDKHPAICTKDHKILIHKNDKNIWVEAQNVKVGDYICCPFVKFDNNSLGEFDLNEFNKFGYEYDEKYIYEPINPHTHGLITLRSISSKLNISKSVLEKFIRDDKYMPFSRLPEKENEFIALTGMSLKEFKDFYINSHIRKIPRYQINDDILNQFIGMMYGDGWNVCEGSKSVFGVCINPTTNKDLYNKKIFYHIMERFGVDSNTILEQKAHDKNLIQLTANSKLICEFLSQYFKSKKGRDKIFNEELFYQNKDNLSGLLKGLLQTDGYCGKDRTCFDNTSSSLSCAYNLLAMSSTDNPVLRLQLRDQRIDSRGYLNQTSYKLTSAIHPYDSYKKIEEFKKDNDYCYIPVTKVDVIKNYSGKVYDITVEGQHDYLLGNMIVHNSAVGCYCNKLLGLTKVDRIDSPVPLFFERFMSKSRMLEAKSMADIDENINNRDIFIQAFTELFGMEHCVPMIAFGTMKVKAAWQMYAKAVNLPFELANEISHRIADYEEYAKYHTSEDDIDVKTVYDFIGEEYKDTFDKSKEYLGIISDWKIAPSAVLVYNGNIEEEIGLVRCKENVCCIVDKFWGDNYKFLKLDILKVSSIELIYKVFNRLGIENKDVPDTNSLLSLVSKDNKSWDIYRNGYTMGVNQVEQPGAVKKVMAYKPHNISELSAFIAAIRPGFKSMYNIFESRQDFKYDIKTLDNLIQTKDMPYSFILYQENIMQMLSFAGIPLDQTYEIVKAISKKKKEKILKHKDQFVKGFVERLISEEGYSEEGAIETTEKVWRIIEDSSRYSFNSAHSYSMAFDSLYGAYLKSHYPLEFYEVFLNLLMERDEKDRAELTKAEAKKAFNIDIQPLRFRQDNRNFSIVEGKNALTDSLKTIKGFGVNVAEELYNLKDRHYDNFIELLDDLSDTTINKSQIDNLILLKYFDEFGKNKKLQSFYMYYQKFRDVKVIKKTDINKYSGKITEKQYRDIDNIGMLSEIFDMFDNEDYEVKIQASKEKNQFGFVKSKLLDVPIDWFYVNELKTYPGNKAKPYVQLYNLHTGVMINAKFKSDAYAEQPFKEGNIIRAVEFKKQNKTKKIDGEWIKTDIKETIIDKFDLLA